LVSLVVFLPLLLTHVAPGFTLRWLAKSPGGEDRNN